MVLGAIDALKVDFAISATGVAGPTGGTAEIPVGTIWIGYGSKDDVRTLKLTEDLVATSISQLPPTQPSSLCSASSRSTKKT